MLRRFAMLGSLIAFAGAYVNAQTFGEITGSISDATGAVIAGAEVTVANLATNQARKATSNDTGIYSVPYLVPGSYNIHASKSGFKVTNRSGVEVEVGGVARIDFKLEIGEVSQTMEVSGGAPQLATETSSIGTVIDNQ